MPVDFAFNQSELETSFKDVAAFFDRTYNAGKRGQAHTYVMLYAAAEARQKGHGVEVLGMLKKAMEGYGKAGEIDPLFRRQFRAPAERQEDMNRIGRELCSVFEAQAAYDSKFKEAPMAKLQTKTGTDILRAMTSDRMELTFETFGIDAAGWTPVRDRGQHSIYLERQASSATDAPRYTIFDPDFAPIQNLSLADAGKWLVERQRGMNVKLITEAPQTPYYRFFAMDLRDISKPPESEPLQDGWRRMDQLCGSFAAPSPTYDIFRSAESFTPSTGVRITIDYLGKLKDGVPHLSANATIVENGKRDQQLTYGDDANFASKTEFLKTVFKDAGVAPTKLPDEAPFTPMMVAAAKAANLLHSVSALPASRDGADKITQAMALPSASVSLAVPH
ncbi:hypothetical protein [Pandoraea norimbergensis]|uniref:Uncharacterized protein n=2 Tax=Pseudomonadota TaxID=1224 RepID=A0ABN4JH13_9BURK|nr:hypothetical protein [Pandoraea norimbergensis]ALS59749.1 hypothetical protein AT302_08280 [Pandoraea norimbergensis]